MFFIALIMLSFAKPPADLKSITYLLSSPPAFWYNSSPYFDFIAGSTPLVPPIFRNPPLACWDFASIGDGRVGRCEGRPSVSPEVRNLIRQMSLANPRWGAPRIRGELLKIGIEVSQATVAKYMARHGKPPSQTWRTFLRTWGKVIGFLRREFHSSVIV